MAIVKHIYEVQQETLLEVLKDIEEAMYQRNVNTNTPYKDFVCDPDKLKTKIHARIGKALADAKEQDDE